MRAVTGPRPEGSLSVAVVESEPELLAMYATWIEESVGSCRVTRVSADTRTLDVSAVDLLVCCRPLPDAVDRPDPLTLAEPEFDCPVVVVSGYDPERTPLGTLSNDPPADSVDDYLLKPVLKPRLSDAVEAALG